MRISDWSSDVCSSDLLSRSCVRNRGVPRILSANDADFRNLWSHNRFAPVQQDQKHKDRGSAGNSMGIQLGAGASHADRLVRCGPCNYAIQGKGDRKRVVMGQGVSVVVDLGGLRNKKK